MHYRHRQFGTTIVASLGVTAGILLVLMREFPIAWIGWMVLGVIAISAVVFSSLEIEVADGTLRWRFGPGLIRKQVPLSEIESIETTRTKFWEGWGVHYTSRGWLYNVSGYQAVLVHMKSGKQFMLGTDEPDRLASALAMRLT